MAGLGRSASGSLQQRRQACREERRINETEFLTKRGEAIRYGSTVQLLHVASGRFVSVARTKAATEVAMKVSVADVGG